jgi:hypothetical protein
MNHPAMTLVWNARWHFAIDMNGDGVFTLDDVWLMVKYIYFAPGDLLIFGHMVDPDLPTLFELDASWLYGWASGVISGIVRFIALGIFGAIVSAIVEKRGPNGTANRLPRRQLT